MENPDTITVVVGQREEVAADKVDVHVTIKGSSLITGSAALKKAKEVSQMVSELAEAGVKETDIVLQTIHAESASGILGKATSASYQIRVRCDNLDLLADILGVVTAQKYSRLDYLSWRYPDDKKLKGDMLQSCLVEAKGKANAIVDRLGVNILGVHALSEKWLDSEQESRAALHEITGGLAKLAASRSRSIDLGFPLSHSKSLVLQLEVRFRVSELV